MDERGHGSVLALGLLFGGALLVGLAVDVARLVAVWGDMSHLAHTAAEAGAGWAEPEALYDGVLRVDVAAAVAAARAVASGPDRTAEVAATPERVCVTVRTEVHPGLIRVVGAMPQEVAATGCAEPRRG